jgi:hypothetical protein
VTSHSAGPLHSGSPEGNAAASPSGPSSAPVDDVKASLWSVSTLPHKGGWAWRFAAGHAGLSVEDYVIGGIDSDFAELLFAAGHAMDPLASSGRARDYGARRPRRPWHTTSAALPA